ncbi:MAG: Rrf2 family transcriptional regulator [Syntrophorhabdaceae bacterium]|nr:Rrf2 family transcriptional regulator [Syntrophorhabdaceae bacterium]
MKISTQIRYGIRSLCDIASNSAGMPVQVKCISERQKISPRYIEQIFQKLKKAGIIKSVRGPTGGYFLGKRPDEISVGDVIRAIEGKDIQLVQCVSQRKGSKKACERYGKCAASEIWGNASRMLMEYFNSITISQMCVDISEKNVKVV